MRMGKGQNGVSTKKSGGFPLSGGISPLKNKNQLGSSLRFPECYYVKQAHGASSVIKPPSVPR